MCQEVFLRCFTSREQVRLSVRLRPWLIGIARNVLHEYVRRKINFQGENPCELGLQKYVERIVERLREITPFNRERATF